MSCFGRAGLTVGEAGFSVANGAPPVLGRPIAFHRSPHSVIPATATQPVLLFVESCGLLGGRAFHRAARKEGKWAVYDSALCWDK